MMHGTLYFTSKACFKLLLLVTCLTACLPIQQPESSSRAVSITEFPVATPTVLESTPTQTLVSTPTVTVSPTLVASSFRLPTPDLVALVPCRGITYTLPSGAIDWDNECDIAVYNSSGGEIVYHIAEENFTYRKPLFSPCGRSMVYTERLSGQARLRLVSTDWQTDRPLTDWYGVSSAGWEVRLEAVAWSPDSTWLAFNYSARWGFDEVRVINVDTGELRQVGEGVTALAWSPQDAIQLAFTIEGGEPSSQGLYLASVEDLENPQRVEAVQLHEGPGQTTLAWHPDGTSLAISTCSSDICSSFAFGLLDLSTHTVDWQWLEQNPGFCHEVVWSPSGRHMACCEEGWVFIYETEQWQLVKRQRAPDPTGGNWVGDEFFLFAERTHTHLPAELGAGLNSWYVAGVTMGRPGEEVLLNPTGLDLEFDSFDMPSWFLAPSWE